MSKIVTDQVTVSSTGDGLLLIHHHQLWDDGMELGGDFVCEASALIWLAEVIDLASGEQGAPDLTALIPPDHFTIVCGGSEWEPNVQVHITRESLVPEGGKTYTLSGLQLPTAKMLVFDLRAVKI
jgi:hypothetical protein